MRHGVSASTILAFTAAAGTLSLAIFTTTSVRSHPRPVPRRVAPPGFARFVEGRRRRDAGEAFLATLSEEQRATAQIELTPRLPSGGRTFRVGATGATASSSATLSPNKLRRP